MPSPFLFLDDNEINKRELYNEETAPFHHLARLNKRKYPAGILRYIQLVYILAVVIWIVLVYILELYRGGIIGWIIILIPLIVFAISFININFHTTDLEKEMFHGNFLSFAFLIVSLLINWTSVGDKRRIFKILMVSLLLLVLSLVDIWVKFDYLILAKHTRSVLQTMSLTLLAYALYIYYTDIVVSDPRKNEINFKDLKTSYQHFSS